MEDMQSTFRCTVTKDNIATRMNLGPTFHKYTLLVGRLVDHMEVDRDDGFAEHEGTLDTTEKNCGHHECEEEDTIRHLLWEISHGQLL